MKLFETKHLIALLGLLALFFSGCASGGNKTEAQQTSQQIDAPNTVSGPDKSLYSQALKAQSAGQFESTIKLWKDFLSSNPDSFEGHNNLGLVYYTQDMLEQALQEFETAYRLEPADPRIRKNLARALRFKVAMVHESRDYFKTLKILARLENIVEPEEKQGILFKQEQVEDQIFLQVIKANNSASYQEFVNRFPDGLNAVRAREYLEKHPHHASKSTSRDTVFKPSSKGKSWISAGKVNKDPDGVIKPWASSEQPPDYSASRPTATYTPPPAGAKKKKSGDFFGTDSAAVEKVEEDNVAAAQAMDPVANIPFEDFEKPERSSEPVAEKESNDGKESLRAEGGFDPMRDEPSIEAAGLDTLPDLKPSPVATPPVEEEAPSAVPDEKPEISQETVSDTVAALIPTLPQETEIVEPPAESLGLSSTMVVIKMKSGSTLNVRAKPSAQGEILGYLENDDMMPFMSESGEWYQIEVEEGLSGWVSKKYSTTREVTAEASSPAPKEDDMASELASLDPESSGAKKGAVVVVTVEEDSTLNVRSIPSPSGAVVDMLFGGDKLPLVKEENGWYQVLFEDETTGWISKKFSVIEVGSPAVSTATAPEASSPVSAPKVKQAPWDNPVQKAEKEMVTTVVVIKVPEGSSLNVRSAPSSQGQVLGSLKRGDMRPLLEENDEWYQVELQNGQSGWVSQKFSGKMSVDPSFIQNP